MKHNEAQSDRGVYPLAPSPLQAKNSNMSTQVTQARIESMDQFRGYTVAGMFLVNFVGSLAAFHAILKHHNVYFSYADTIMPSFIFAVGFSYRLTILRRLPERGAFKTYFSYIKRSLALILVSLMLFSFGNGFKEWKDFNKVPRSYTVPEILVEKPKKETTEGEKAAEMEDADAADKDNADAEKKDGDGKKGKSSESDEAKSFGQRVESFFEYDKKPVPDYFGLNWRMFAMKVLKADMWDVLAIIAVTQIFIMPVIAARWWVRLLALVACGIGHLVITQWFNWDFLFGIDALYRITEAGAVKHVGGFQGLLGDVLPSLQKIYSSDPAQVTEYVRKLYDLTADTGGITLPDGRLVQVEEAGSWMNALWGLHGARVWDGGFFGFVSWAVAMLAGTLVYDLRVAFTANKAAVRLLAWGVVAMAIGYGMSCLTRLYDLQVVPGGEEVAKVLKGGERPVKRLIRARDKKNAQLVKERDEKQGIELLKKAKIEGLTKEEIEKLHKDVNAEVERLQKETDGLIDQNNKATDAEIEKVRKELEAKVNAIREEHRQEAEPIQEANQELLDPRTGDLAKSPIIPPFVRAEGRAFAELLAEAPFVPPPETRADAANFGKQARLQNYWAMNKRVVSLSFIVFSTGLAIALYALFVMACDIGGLHVGLFRTFGMNPLAAYAIHEVVMAVFLGHVSDPLVPEDSPLWYALPALIIFYGIVYMFVRHLEKNKIFIRM